MILHINDRLRNRRISYFDSVNVTLRYDSVASTFQLAYYFDPNNSEHKEFSCVSHFHECTLEDDGEIVITGYILTINFKDDNTRSLVNITGYSRPGFLEDCSMPLLELSSLQSDKLSLKQITSKILAPFKIGLVIHSRVASLMDEEFDQSDAKIQQNVRTYLSDLASQKDINLTHDEYGNLVFTRAVHSKPIYNFERSLPVTGMELNFNGQGMHSRITVLGQADVDEEAQAAQSTPISYDVEQLFKKTAKPPGFIAPPVSNPYVPFVFRPKIITQSSGKESDTLKAANNAIAQELRGLQLTVSLDRWKLNGKIVRPGRIVSILNPYIYIYKKTDFFIESVDLKENTAGQTATLHLCVPESFTSEAPNYIFKGINLH